MSQPGQESAPQQGRGSSTPQDVQARIMNMSPYDIPTPGASKPAYLTSGSQNFQASPYNSIAGAPYASASLPQSVQNQVQTPLPSMPAPGQGQNIVGNQIPQQQTYQNYQNQAQPREIYQPNQANPYVLDHIKNQQLANPGIIHPVNKIYSQRNPQQRAEYIQDLILRYPDILTLDEQAKLARLREYMLFGVTTGIMAMPYSFYLGKIQARKNPSLRTTYVRRMALLPTIPLGILLVAGYYSNKNFDYLGQKYFGHLSDNDLDSFETYYHMLKNGMPAGSANIQASNSFIQPMPQQQFQPNIPYGQPPTYGQPQYFQPPVVQTQNYPASQNPYGQQGYSLQQPSQQQNLNTPYGYQNVSVQSLLNKEDGSSNRGAADIAKEIKKDA